MDQSKENKKMRNPDGTFTSFGAKHYGREGGKATKKRDDIPADESQQNQYGNYTSTHSESRRSTSDQPSNRDNIYDQLRDYSE